MVGQSGLGYLARSHSIAAGYVAGGLTTFLALPALLILRAAREPADRIRGTAARGGACAAQGLPAVSSLDTRATAA